MHHSACQRFGEHRQETCRPFRDITKAFHQSLKQSALRILVAIADSYPPGMLPDLGGHEQKNAIAPLPASYAEVPPPAPPLPAETATTSNSGCRPTSPVENARSWWPSARKDAPPIRHRCWPP